MAKFKQEMKKIGSIKNTWYEWLINDILEPIRKSVGGFNDKIGRFFKTKKEVRKKKRNL